MDNLKRTITGAAIICIVGMITACEKADSPAAKAAPLPTEPTYDTVTIRWDIPVQRIDDTDLALDQIGGYKIYVGSSQNDLSLQVIDVNDAATTSYTVTNLPPGENYFAVTAYDTYGFESSFSEVKRVEL